MKLIKMYLVLVLLLIITQFSQMYINYAKADTFKEVEIYWYKAENVMLINDGNETILFDIKTNRVLVVYETKYIIISKEPFDFLKGKDDYKITITFTEEFLKQM